MSGQKSKSSHERILASLVEDALAGRLTFIEFARRYGDYFVDVLPEDELSDDDYAFFSQVHEKLDWTSDNVDDESRRYGWVTAGEFLDWLRAAWRSVPPSGGI